MRPGTEYTACGPVRRMFIAKVDPTVTLVLGGSRAKAALPGRVAADESAPGCGFAPPGCGNVSERAPAGFPGSVARGWRGGGCRGSVAGGGPGWLWVAFVWGGG